MKPNSELYYKNLKILNLERGIRIVEHRLAFFDNSPIKREKYDSLLQAMKKEYRDLTGKHYYHKKSK